MDKELYYINLDAIYKAFGETPATVGLRPVAKFLGVDERTLKARRDFPIKKNGRMFVVVKTALASWMTRS